MSTNPRATLRDVVAEAERTGDWGVVLKREFAERLLGMLPHEDGPVIAVGSTVRVQYGPDVEPTLCRVLDVREGHVVLGDPGAEDQP